MKIYQAPILLKGYNQVYNPEKDYKKAKTPICEGFTKADYKPPTQSEIDAWIKKGGWVGYLVPEGIHILDVEDLDAIKMIRAICSEAGITVPINHTKNGVQFVFRVTEDSNLGCQSRIYTKSGVPVTYRAGGKSYVILPPINGRTWENEEQLNDPPLMPDMLYPAQNTVEHTVRAVAWELGVAYRAGQVSGFEDIDAGFMALLVSHGIPEAQVLEAFKLTFLDNFDESLTLNMFQRTKERLASGQPIVGTGSLIKKLQEQKLTSIITLIEKLERLTGKDSGSEGENKKSRPPSVADRLINLARDKCELFHDKDGKAYAKFQTDGHHETVSLESRAFERFLLKLLWDECRKSINGQGMKDAVRTLESHAVFENGSVKKVHVRLAEKDGTIYLDLGNDAREVVAITSEGWRVVSDQEDVKFIRPQGLSALPYPEVGGSIDLLRKHINLADGGDFLLLVGYILMCFNPWGPYPILVFTGEQGTAKSTGQRVVKRLTDPSKAPLRSAPSDKRDLAISASNSWVLGFDNVSSISNDLSDALCRISTGGGFSVRKLYTDEEETIFDTKCPLMLNGITNFVRRPDLAGRCIIVRLDVIPDHMRQSETDFWQMFDEDASRILGAILDGVSGALRNYKNITLARSPRMADFAIWATAAEEDFGWKKGDFMAAYSNNQEEISGRILEGDLVGTAVMEFMESNEFEPWEGTATELLKQLEESNDQLRESDIWPKDGSHLSNWLFRCAPVLRAEGINVTRPPRSGKQRIIRLEKTADTFRLDLPELPQWMKDYNNTPQEFDRSFEEFMGGIDRIQ